MLPALYNQVQMYVYIAAYLYMHSIWPVMPVMLLQAYSKCDGTKEAELLLQDIVVSNCVPAA